MKMNLEKIIKQIVENNLLEIDDDTDHIELYESKMDDLEAYLQSCLSIMTEMRASDNAKVHKELLLSFKQRLKNIIQLHKELEQSF